MFSKEYSDNLFLIVFRKLKTPRHPPSKKKNTIYNDAIYEMKRNKIENEKKHVYETIMIELNNKP